MVMNKYRIIGIWALTLLGGATAWPQAVWQMPGASVRFETHVASRPTIPAAGIVAILPDAGILPKGKLKVDVTDNEGKPLKSNLLWHNPDEGLALVFEDIPTEQVWIYVSPSPDYPKATAPLRPSLLLFVRNGGKPGLDQAQALAEKTPVGPDVYFTTVDQIFHSLSPVGRDENTSSCYSGWFQVKKAGKTFFYTESQDGSEFFIDDKLVCSWPGVHPRSANNETFGEKGVWLDLSAGLHRIQYYHFAQKLRGRECQLGWQQAGEPQPKNPKNPKLPNLKVTAPMDTEDFVHSGTARLTAGYSKQGPLAIFTNYWEAIFQPGQEPVCLFQFYAFGSDLLPTNTVYEWDFGGDRKLQGPQVAWLYGGMDDQRVSLTISSGAGKSTCSRVFFPKSRDLNNEPPRLSINRAENRSKLRDIFLTMCRATPAGRRPCELWNATLWEGFLAVLDYQCDYALLSELFDRSRQDILSLDKAKRWLMEDAFFAALRQAAPQATIAWLDRFEKEEKDPARIGQWKARRVEFYIFEGDNLDQARLAANAFTGAAAGLQQIDLAMIRIGDVELFSGHQDIAQRFYAQAQEAHQRQAKLKAAMPTIKPDEKQSAHKPEPKSKSDDKAGGAAEKKKGAKQSGKPTPANGAFIVPSVQPVIDEWKVSAVHASSYYSTMRSLISQQAYGEAQKILDQWEMELPLDKLAGDLPLAQAEFYIAIKQFKRAQKILKMYRQAVDLTNTLPQAMKMELYCLTQMDRDKEARELAALIIKRLPNHPLAEEVKGLLETAADGKLAVSADTWSQDWTSSEKVDAAGLAGLFSTNKMLGIRKKPAPQTK